LFPPRQTAPADDVAIYLRHRDRVLVTMSPEPRQALGVRDGFELKCAGGGPDVEVVNVPDGRQVEFRCRSHTDGVGGAQFRPFKCLVLIFELTLVWFKGYSSFSLFSHDCRTRSDALLPIPVILPEFRRGRPRCPATRPRMYHSRHFVPRSV